MEARTERRLWKQTIQAFGVQSWSMTPERGGQFTSPTQYEDAAAMLAAYPGRKSFLIAPGRVDGAIDLADYVHPATAIYVFGNAGQSLAKFVTDDDDVVSITTPNDTDMFASAALAAVLYSRTVKT